MPANQVKSINQLQQSGSHLANMLCAKIDFLDIMAAKPFNSGQASRPGYYSASGLGCLAFECIQPESEGFIFGVVSRGIFIQTSTKWLLFISNEPYPGPLTINVPGIRNPGIPLDSGMQVRIASGILAFPEADLVITTQNLTPWQPKSPQPPVLSGSERQKKLLTGSRVITSTNQHAGLSLLLPLLVQMPGAEQVVIDQFPSWYKIILNLAQDGAGIQSPSVLFHLLGAGQGLTPSGDDFVMGVLLAFNRWQQFLPIPQDLGQFNRQLISAAYKKTTTLSANLIECAARGLADLRLINALDWLVSGGEPGEQAIDELLTWGHSSGSDAFVGFAVALSRRNPQKSNEES
jgi:hypothetical protein